MNSYPHISSLLYNTPLLIHPAKAEVIIQGLGERIAGQPIVMNMQEDRTSFGILVDKLGAKAKQNGQQLFDTIENVAVISIEGTLVHKGAFVGSYSGDTSYQGIQSQIIQAANDSRIKAVVLEVDSFGGQASGAFETSDMIYNLSKIKPTISILTENAHSAGYLMAAAARQIIIPENGGAGSVGAVIVHKEMSKALEASGIKVTVLAAGKNKADGNPFEPLPKEVADKIKSELEKSRLSFATRIATYRQGRITLKSILETEAGSFYGADAVSVGLVDAVGASNLAFNEFIKMINRN